MQFLNSSHFLPRGQNRTRQARWTEVKAWNARQSSNFPCLRGPFFHSVRVVRRATTHFLSCESGGVFTVEHSAPLCRRGRLFCLTTCIPVVSGPSLWFLDLIESRAPIHRQCRRARKAWAMNLICVAAKNAVFRSP